MAHALPADLWLSAEGRLGGQAAVRRQMQAMLWARANHSRAALTLAVPRTMRRSRPRLRAGALTHSAVCARSL